MLPLNYTAGSRKPIAVPVDLKQRHRGSPRRTAADGVAWLYGLTGSVSGPSIHRDATLSFATTTASGRDGGNPTFVEAWLTGQVAPRADFRMDLSAQGTIRLIRSSEVGDEATPPGDDDTRSSHQHGRAGLGADRRRGPDAWQHRHAVWDYRFARRGIGWCWLSGRAS